jgi:NADH/F420H2 dehydrogenase subunit C
MNLIFVQSILASTPRWIQRGAIVNGEIIFHVYPEYISLFIEFLKNNILSQTRILIDITGVDFPSRPDRLEVVYQLLSTQYNIRIRIKTCVNEITPLSSITSIFPSASWWERETWDMFGVFFSNHPDLRRILTDYGFEGFPLRKDFPLSGYSEVHYDEAEKRVISEPIELAQEFRYFDFSSPWEQGK